MATWRVFTLDVWGNAEDGYEVNDRCFVGKIETSNEAPDAEVWCALLEAGIARGSISDGTFDGDGWDMWIDERETGKPVFQLERQEEP